MPSAPKLLWEQLLTRIIASLSLRPRHKIENRPSSVCIRRQKPAKARPIRALYSYNCGLIIFSGRKASSSSPAPISPFSSTSSYRLLPVFNASFDRAEQVS